MGEELSEKEEGGRQGGERSKRGVGGGGHGPQLSALAFTCQAIDISIVAKPVVRNRNIFKSALPRTASMPE